MYKHETNIKLKQRYVIRICDTAMDGFGELTRITSQIVVVVVVTGGIVNIRKQTNHLNIV